ncbi:MAG: DUF3791 domain-containing protein [Muribaculaceae bacterium]|nr:DUF3791 domain-containing protein [Muribaculaceae bacterium]
MSREELNLLKYTIAVVAEFAKHFGISQKQSFNYLKRFLGLDYLLEYYDVLHTLSFEDAIEAMTAICKRNGGLLQ